MKLRHLHAFEAALRLGSLNLAAAESNLSQSALSYAVAIVEKRFGQFLLIRGPQGCVATPAGIIVAARAQTMFRRLEAALESLPVGRKTQGTTRRLSRSISLDQIEAVISLVRRHRPSTAAKQLDISEGALLRRLHELENLLSIKIFERSRTEFIISDAAQDFIVQLSRAVRELDYADYDLADEDKPGARKITVGCLGSARTALLPLVITDFAVEQPGTTVKLFHESFDVLFTRLLLGELDMLICAERVEADIDQIVSEYLYTDDHGIICRNSHPLVDRAKVSEDDLLKFEWILPMGGNPLRDLFESRFAHVHDRLRVVLETHSTTTALTLLHTGDRLMIGSRQAMQTSTLMEHLTMLPLEVPSQTRGVRVYTRRDARMPKPQMSFLAVLRQKAGALALSPV